MLNNSAAAELLGSEQLYDLELDPEETRNLAADHPRTEELRRRALRHIVEHGRGLLLRCLNPSPGELTVDLSGADLNLVRTKATTLAAERLEWTDGRQLRVRLAPSEEMTLLLEDAEEQRLGVRITAATGAELSLALASRELPLRVVWPSGESLRIGDRAPSAPLVFEADWLGPRGGTPDEGDENEIEQQLEALGYLD
jgi:hypothetical protein